MPHCHLVWRTKNKGIRAVSDNQWKGRRAQQHPFTKKSMEKIQVSTWVATTFSNTWGHVLNPDKPTQNPFMHVRVRRASRYLSAGVEVHKYVMIQADSIYTLRMLSEVIVTLINKVQYMSICTLMTARAKILSTWREMMGCRKCKRTWSSGYVGDCDSPQIPTLRTKLIVGGACDSTEHDQAWSTTVEHLEPCYNSNTEEADTCMAVCKKEKDTPQTLMGTTLLVWQVLHITWPVYSTQFHWEWIQAPALTQTEQCSKTGSRPLPYSYH